MIFKCAVLCSAVTLSSGQQEKIVQMLKLFLELYLKILILQSFGQNLDKTEGQFPLPCDFKYFEIFTSAVFSCL